MTMCGGTAIATGLANTNLLSGGTYGNFKGLQG